MSRQTTWDVEMLLSNSKFVETMQPGMGGRLWLLMDNMYPIKETCIIKATSDTKVKVSVTLQVSLVDEVLTSIGKARNARKVTFAHKERWGNLKRGSGKWFVKEY